MSRFNKSGLKPHEKIMWGVGKRNDLEEQSKGFSISSIKVKLELLKLSRLNSIQFSIWAISEYNYEFYGEDRLLLEDLRYLPPVCC